MLEGLFNPRRIAVVGASRKAGSVGRAVLENLQRSPWATRVVPVNPGAVEIAGIAAVPEVASLGTDVDLAVVCVPAVAVPAVMEACGTRGIRNAIVISAGFKEIGAAGAELEEGLGEICRRHGIHMVGPNCLGVLVPATGLNASFADRLPPAGPIGLMTQSGALATALLDVAESRGLGFSKIVSLGNKAVLDETDILAALRTDPETRVVAAYLEDIGRGDDFVHLAEKVSREKPIIVVKAGTSDAGARAATSHTGSLVGSDVAYDAAFARSGIVRAHSLEELLDAARAFGHAPLPAGRRVAIVTNAGGPGILAADACEREGLEAPLLSAETRAALAAVLPAAAATGNPVDVLGDAPPRRYRDALEMLLRDGGIDAVLVLLTPQAMTDAGGTAEVIAELATTSRKPLLASFLGGPKVSPGVARLRKAGIATYAGPERALRSLRAMVGYRQWLDRPPRVVKRFAANRYRVERVIKVARRRGRDTLGEQEAHTILSAYGFHVPQGRLARTPDEAVDAAAAIGFPVALKVASGDILHKTDAGGVKLHLGTDEAVRDAFELMMLRVRQRRPDARVQGALVQQMVEGGKEVILGVTRDPHFGPMLMFGLGGVYVEVLKDVAFHLAPITREEALEMLYGTKTYALLAGVRGEEAVDVGALAESIQRLSQLVTDAPEILEMDINPLKVGSRMGMAWAIDARFRVRRDAP